MIWKSSFAHISMILGPRDKPGCRLPSGQGAFSILKIHHHHHRHHYRHHHHHHCTQVGRLLEVLQHQREGERSEGGREQGKVHKVGWKRENDHLWNIISRLDIEYRSLLFAFIDNVKPSTKPDKKVIELVKFPGFPHPMFPHDLPAPKPKSKYIQNCLKRTKL